MQEAHFPVQPAAVIFPVSTWMWYGTTPTYSLPPLRVTAPPPTEATVFSAISTPGTSASLDVRGKTHHTVQVIMTGTATLHTRTSLDGTNWKIEHVATDTGLWGFRGAFRNVSFAYVAGNGVVTVNYLSSE
jgi:hypothetical protein